MANLKNLKPFTGANDPRRSNGRPKGIPNAKTRWNKILKLLQEKENPVTGEMESLTVLEQIDAQLFMQALKGNVLAIDKIYDRLEGKVPLQQDDPEKMDIKFEFTNKVPEPKE